MTTGIVDRLHAYLLDSIERKRPDRSDAPVTVSEIYEDLAPYDEVRSHLGVEMNTDYEHALLRLLAGENGLARIEPEDAQAELRRELDSSNPNVGVFHQFSGCDVWLRPRHDVAPPAFLEPTLDSSPPAAEPEEGSENGQHGHSAGDTAIALSDIPESGLMTSASPDACGFCDGAMPAGRDAHFCPHCGADQQTHPCGQCGEVLEHDWRYCIRCGQSVLPA